MKRMFIAAIISLAACSSSGDDATVILPNGRGNITTDGVDNKNSHTLVSSTILYHGGSLMLGTPNVYLIWYGNWAGNTATTIIPSFLTSLSGSPYFKINTTYYDRTGAHVSGNFTLAGQTNDAYSRGTSLTDADVQAIVFNSISNGSLPSDTNGVYFVLTSADVNETSGACTSYCGWHTYGFLNGANIKYAYIVNPGRCLNACAAQTISPNNNPAADAEVSIIAHELEESETDENLNAWFSRRGAENADLCQWNFLTTYTTANGSKANMNLGGKNYLVQANWLNVGSGKCALHYP